MTDRKMTADEALVKLYTKLAERNKGSFGSMTGEEQLAYRAAKNRTTRAKARAAAEKGLPLANAANLRSALAEAAMLVLRDGGPAAEMVKARLAEAFPAAPGVVPTLEHKVNAGWKPTMLVKREVQKEPSKFTPPWFLVSDPAEQEKLRRRAERQARSKKST